MKKLQTTQIHEDTQNTKTMNRNTKKDWNDHRKHKKGLERPQKTQKRIVTTTENTKTQPQRKKNETEKTKKVVSSNQVDECVGFILLSYYAHEPSVHNSGFGGTVLMELLILNPAQPSTTPTPLAMNF